MRLFAAVAALLLFTGCANEEADRPLAVAPRGDIILVTIDTWRHDAAGFAGNSRAKTPYLDSLAARGTVFSNAHAHNVVTLPSHANILTGLLPYEHGIRDNSGFVLDGKYDTVAEILGRNGYATGAFVAAYPLDAKFGLAQGFDEYDDAYGKGTVRTTFAMRERSASEVLGAAAAWWERAGDRKRFMWIHLFEPHAPYEPPSDVLAATGDAYLGEVAVADAALGRVLPRLERPGTTIIVTSDHGEALGDHGELTHGLFAYEATLKVPLIVVAPGLPARVETAPVRHVDIAPTILEAAGVRAPPHLPGQSLLGPVEERDTYFESLSANLNRGWAPLTGVIRGGFKYVDLPIAELYELATDPREERNLRSEKRREAEGARKLLASLSAAPPARNRGVSAEEAATLRSLGYVAGSAAAGTTYTADDDPKNLVALDAMMHRAIDAEQRGERAEALRLARGVVAARPDMTAGRELLAYVLQQNERLDEAIHVLLSLVADGTAGAESRIQLANALIERGRAAEAATVLSAAAATGADPQVLNTYGTALAESGKTEEAIAQFRRALAADPGNPPALQNIGIVLLRTGDAAAAREHLTRALQANPDLPLALNALGVLHARGGDSSAAIDAWQRAVKIDPRQYDALFNLALVASRAGRRDEAITALQQFVSTAPPQRYGRDIAVAREALKRLRSS